MSFSLALVYKQSQRLCQPRSDHSVNQELIARNVPRRLRPSNDSVANGKYGRSLPLPWPESKAFSRLRAHLFMFFPLRSSTAEAFAVPAFASISFSHDTNLLRH